MHKESFDSQKEKSQLTLREYMKNYNSKRSKKGLNSDLHKEKEENNVSLFRLKIE